MTTVRIIALGNGAAGAEKQAIALCARLRQHLQRLGVHTLNGDAIDVVRVPLGPSLVHQKLPPFLQLLGSRLLGDPFFGYSPTAAQRTLLLETHTADKHVVIGCGRSTISLCAALKRPGMFNIQIQHPRVNLDAFDAVLIPRHDLVASPRSRLSNNVYPTYGTVCWIDAKRLQEQAMEWQDALRPYTEQRTMRLVWLVGGPCRGFKFTQSEATTMVLDVLNLVKKHRPNASLLVTFSRRTPQWVQDLVSETLKEALANDELYIWNGTGANPYEAFLHVASTIITTPDSISMTTEALASGKPVVTLGADYMKGKYRHFHEALSDKKYTSTLASQPQLAVTQGQEAIEQELERIAASLAERLVKE